MKTWNFYEFIYARVANCFESPKIQNEINFPEKISILNIHSLAFFTWIQFQVPFF